MQDVIDMSKEDLKERKWREDNGDLVELIESEVEKICSLKNCITYLMNKGDFTSEVRKLRWNTITLEDSENFIYHENSKILLKSTGDMPPNNLPGLSGSSGSYSKQLTPFEYFKRSIKED